MAPFIVDPQRLDSYKNFKFRVKWAGRYVAGFSKMSDLKQGTQIVAQREGGEVSSLASHKYDAVTLERGATHDGEFDQWASTVRNPGSDQDHNPAQPGFRQDIFIEIHNEAGQPASAYCVFRCWVSAYQALPDLDANANAVAIQTLRLENEGWQRDDAVPDTAEARFVAPGPQRDGLAQRIEPEANWEDLVLAEPLIAQLRRIAVQLRQYDQTSQDSRFAAAHSSGASLATLFIGESGTGKTMAVEVLARDSGRDLYRIDLSAVVSKYIGDTEKNLNRLFEAAEGSGAILLFDEADALFGKRSEVRDSHDRYANIEINYLLQRMESYRGLAVLVTNQTSRLDSALLRRLRFVLEFPFPDIDQRTRIWRRVFSTSPRSQGLDARRLARLNMTGGSIRNIARDANSLAAAAGTEVTMTHVLQAAHTEAARHDRPLTEVETREWP